MIDEEYELHYKLRKVKYLFERKSIEEKIKTLFDIEFIFDLSDLFETYFDELCDEFNLSSYIFTNECTYKNVREEWGLLDKEEQLELIIKLVCDNNLHEYIEDNVNNFFKYFDVDNLKIHWVKIIPLEIIPRDDLIDKIKEMLVDEQRQYLIEKNNIDKNINLDLLSDNELSSLHYQILGIIY